MPRSSRQLPEAIAPSHPNLRLEHVFNLCSHTFPAENPVTSKLRNNFMFFLFLLTINSHKSWFNSTNETVCLWTNCYRAVID